MTKAFTVVAATAAIGFFISLVVGNAALATIFAGVVALQAGAAFGSLLLGN